MNPARMSAWRINTFKKQFRFVKIQKKKQKFDVKKIIIMFIIIPSNFESFF